MGSWFQKMVKRVREVPPACLRGFTVTPLHPARWSGRVGWALRCRCGGRTGKLMAHPLAKYNPDYHGPPVFISPLAFRCAPCGKTTPIIDTQRHGYNSEIDKPGESLDSNYRGTGRRQEVPCPKCGGREFSLTAFCAHSDFDLIEDEPELEPRAQEYFDWFECRGACASCGKQSSLADFELA